MVAEGAFDGALEIRACQHGEFAPVHRRVLIFASPASTDKPQYIKIAASLSWPRTSLEQILTEYRTAHRKQIPTCSFHHLDELLGASNQKLETIVIQQEKSQQFVGQVLSDLGGASRISMAQIGGALGPYRTLHAKDR